MHRSASPATAVQLQPLLPAPPQVDLASCGAGKARAPADCIAQADALLTAWRPSDD